MSAAQNAGALYPANEMLTRGERVVLNLYVISALLVFVLMMLLGLTMRTSQSTWMNVPPNIFYEIMTAHGADLKKRYDPIDELSDPVQPKTEPRSRETILHIAGVSAADWVVPFLAAHGAPLDAKNSLGETPLQLADEQERFRYAKDSEGPLGGGIGKEKVFRETQTTDALKKVSAPALASAKAPRHHRPAA